MADHPQPAVVAAWHAAHTALQQATNREEFIQARDRFCAATDAVVTTGDAAGRPDLAQPVSDYRDCLLAAHDLLAGTPFATAEDGRLAPREAPIDEINRKVRLPLPACARKR